MKMSMYVKEVHIVVKVFHDTLHSHWIYWKRSFIDREIKPTKILCKSTFCAIDMISNYKQQEQDAAGSFVVRLGTISCVCSIQCGNMWCLAVVRPPDG